VILKRGDQKSEKAICQSKEKVMTSAKRGGLFGMVQTVAERIEVFLWGGEAQRMRELKGTTMITEKRNSSRGG